MHGNIFTRCGCSFPSCTGHCMTVHSFARSKLPRQNIMNDVRLFSRVLVSISFHMPPVSLFFCSSRFTSHIPSKSCYRAYMFCPCAPLSGLDRQTSTYGAFTKTFNNNNNNNCFTHTHTHTHIHTHTHHTHARTHTQWVIAVKDCGGKLAVGCRECVAFVDRCMNYHTLVSCG